MTHKPYLYLTKTQCETWMFSFYRETEKQKEKETERIGGEKEKWDQAQALHNGCKSKQNETQFFLFVLLQRKNHPHFSFIRSLAPRTPTTRLFNGNEAKEPQALEMDKAPSGGCHTVFNAFFNSTWNLFFCFRHFFILFLSPKRKSTKFPLNPSRYTLSCFCGTNTGF